tara:strand:- start:39 stop:482 length:444 start_codon:yes stop_codon:yes gene_type:complete
MDKFIIFHAGAIDSDTVSVQDAGTHLDMAAFLAKDLKCIAAKNGGVELTFDETGKLNAASSSQNTAGAAGNDETNALENTLVTLTVANAKIPTVIKNLCLALNSKPHADGNFLFDAINGVYPGDLTDSDITGITIARTTTSIVVAAA